MIERLRPAFDAATTHQRKSSSPVAAQIKRHRPDAAARRSPMPAFSEPMRPILAAKPFSDPAWLFELKLDGWRTLCLLREGKAHLVSRRRKSLNERFPELREIGELIKAKTAVIDGEVVALDQDGLPQFDALRSRRLAYRSGMLTKHLLR